ncbi:hypothetical protein BC834DRAFT_974310 [Gloeopeniophorella convolvens]|nr:hypothetical protein BC834DRAFT_974310 [Gloeopeniophorella convolvens]
MQATDKSAADVEGRPNLAVAGEEASEMVIDDLSEEEHRHSDQKRSFSRAISDFKTPNQTLRAMDLVLGAVNVAKLLEENPWLASLVRECCKTETARKLRLLKILRKPSLPRSLPLGTSRVPDDTEEEKQSRLFGLGILGSSISRNATDVLLAIISDYLKTKRNNYAPLASIINSSGTGKSRMVDELAKTIISVPMCLRDAGSKGFPPADGSLRDWKTWTVDDMLAGKYKPSEETERKNAAAFFVRRQERLASAFRRLMTHGQAFGSANDYRKKFYKDVIDGARTFASGSRRVHEQRQRHRPGGDEVERFIDPARVWGDQAGKETDLRRPFLILAFDESHRLTESDKQDGWSVFSELRLPSILSTLPSDPSSRISREEYSVLPPITETGFDVLAPVACEGVVTLSQVTGLDWICHLGRPLFGSLYDFAPNSIARKNIHRLAKHKILGGNFTVAEAIEKWKQDVVPAPGNCVLASVAIRFALEFNPTTKYHRDAVLTLVERHMRLCISATSGFEALSTTSSSEPILAEAAQEILYEIGQSPVQHLAGRLDHPFIDRGNRGELTALLILMAARDKVASIAKTRDIFLCDFLEALMPGFAYAQLKEALPHHHRTEAEKQSFGDAFKDSRLWFNHVIKIHDSSMLSSHELWKFMTRGAVIMCAPNQTAVDIVIPFCFSGDVLSRKTVSAIFIQVKNDKSFGPAANTSLFHAIDPFSIKVYQGDETPLPCIRMVFALASKAPAVHISKPSEHDTRHSKRFTAYDIWFSGIWPETFPLIGNEREEYKIILQRSMPDQKAAYADSDPNTDKQVKQARENIRRNLTPLCAIEPAHHTKYRKLEEIAVQ